MNDTIVIRIPTSVASKAISRLFAIAVVGALFGLYMASSDKSEYEASQEASAEQQKVTFDRYQRDLEESANRGIPGTIFVGIFGTAIFCGFYELLAFLASAVTGWFYGADTTEIEDGTSAWSDPSDEGSER